MNNLLFSSCSVWFRVSTVHVGDLQWHDTQSNRSIIIQWVSAWISPTSVTITSTHSLNRRFSLLKKQHTLYYMFVCDFMHFRFHLICHFNVTWRSQQIIGLNVRNTKGRPRNERRPLLRFTYKYWRTICFETMNFLNEALGTL